MRNTRSTMELNQELRHLIIRWENFDAMDLIEESVCEQILIEQGCLTAISEDKRRGVDVKAFLRLFELISKREAWDLEQIIESGEDYDWYDKEDDEDEDEDGGDN